MRRDRLSSARHFVWPARSADGSAPQIYQGTGPNYAMGTLLAIPRAIRLRDHAWHTAQRRRLATATQVYGWYVVDTVPSDQIQFAIENQAARRDLGLEVDPGNGFMGVDPAKVDADGLTLDVLQILTQVRAVTANLPTGN